MPSCTSETTKSKRFLLACSLFTERIRHDCTHPFKSTELSSCKDGRRQVLSYRPRRSRKHLESYPR